MSNLENTRIHRRRAAAIAAVAMMAVAGAAQAAAIRVNPGFDTNTLARNDDGSTGAVALGFGIDFYGLAFNTAFVNNNGKVNRNLLNALKTTTESGAYYASMQNVSIDTLTSLAPSAGLRPKTLIAPK